jgi:hypothetical protein
MSRPQQLLSTGQPTYVIALRKEKLSRLPRERAFVKPVT